MLPRHLREGFHEPEMVLMGPELRRVEDELIRHLKLRSNFREPLRRQLFLHVSRDRRSRHDHDLPCRNAAESNDVLLDVARLANDPRGPTRQSAVYRAPPATLR